jgi:hypothetical protein
VVVNVLLLLLLLLALVVVPIVLPLLLLHLLLILAPCHLHHEVKVQAQEGVIALSHRAAGFGCIAGELDAVHQTLDFSHTSARYH